MAEVRPFAGLRYDPAVVGDLAATVCPPYDIIAPAAQREYYQRSPHNIIRLELTLTEGNEGPAEKYRRAGRTFREWLRAGVLKPEPMPAFYVYDQTFEVHGQTLRRRGLAVAVRLEDWSNGVVLPHESTHAKPKADRLALMRACAANLSPIFSMYDDPHREIAAHLDVATAGPATAELRDEQGDEHALWVVTDPTVVAAVARAFHDRVIYIADGHHRYETALAYRDEQMAMGGSGDEAWRFVLMVLTAVEDPGMVILPTHRTLHGLPSEVVARLPEALEQCFDVQVLADDAQVREAVATAGAGQPAFAVASPAFGDTRARLLVLRDRRALDLLPRERSAAWRELDVSVAHTLILERMLGLPPERIEEHVAYTRDAREALELVRSGESQVALIVNPTRVSQVCDVARAGDRMPQKSTYYYPKLLTGLIIHHLAGSHPDPSAAGAG